MEKNLKTDLIDKFISLGGCYSKEAKSLEKKINKYLKENGDNDVHLLEILRLLKAYQKQVKAPNAFEESCEIVSPIIKRLLETNVTKWITPDIKIGQSAVFWTKNFKDADILAEKVLVALDRLNSSKAYQIKLSVYLNMTERMIVADRAIENWKISLEIEEIFLKYLNRGLVLCTEIGEKLRHYDILLKIREAIYPKEAEGFQKADKLLEDFKKLVPKELYKVIKDSTSLYSVGEEINMTKKQFNHLCGKRMREQREALGISPKKLAEDLGGDLTADNINSLEIGKVPFDGYLLFKIADRLQITVDEFLKGIKVEKFTDEEEEALARFNKVAKGLGKKLINKFADMAESLNDKVEIEKEKVEARKSLRVMYKFGKDDENE
ncbi:MAG: helix-turn-helix domain-containing protein [Defluviitaleaceae bacterium]|nr:helix-turn-helix domain-containing protein [Defluviitaleaceae bacterium]